MISSLGETPMLSGVHAPGNSLTSQGPTQEPYGTGEAAQAKKQQMAMMLMGQQMKQMGAQGQSMPGMAPGLALDIYGQPV